MTPDSPGRRTAARHAILVGLLVATCAAVAARGAPLAAQPIAIAEQVSPRASIEILARPATLRVSAWDRDALDLRTGGDLRLDASLRREGERVEVVIERRGPTDAARGTRDTVYVRVPRGADVTAGSYWGAVDVSGVEGMVRIETYFESATYRGSARDLDVTAFHAGTEIEMTGPSTIAVTSGGGDVRILAAGGGVRVETVRGDIALDASTPLDRAELISTQGSIRFDAPFSERALVVLDAYSGDVDIGLAPGASARVTLEAYAGSIENALGESSPPGDDPLRPRVVELTVGDGRARLAATSVRGDLRLVRRAAPGSSSGPLAAARREADRTPGSSRRIDP